jgi:hypothetical protein
MVEDDERRSRVVEEVDAAQKSNVRTNKKRAEGW